MSNRGTLTPEPRITSSIDELMNNIDEFTKYLEENYDHNDKHINLRGYCLNLLTYHTSYLNATNKINKSEKYAEQLITRRLCVLQRLIGYMDLINNTFRGRYFFEKSVIRNKQQRHPKSIKELSDDFNRDLININKNVNDARQNNVENYGIKIDQYIVKSFNLFVDYLNVTSNIKKAEQYLEQSIFNSIKTIEDLNWHATTAHLYDLSLRRKSSVKIKTIDDLLNEITRDLKNMNKDAENVRENNDGKKGITNEYEVKLFNLKVDYLNVMCDSRELRQYPESLALRRIETIESLYTLAQQARAFGANLFRRNQDEKDMTQNDSVQQLSKKINSDSITVMNDVQNMRKAHEYRAISPHNYITRIFNSFMDYLNVTSNFKGIDTYTEELLYNRIKAIEKITFTSQSARVYDVTFEKTGIQESKSLAELHTNVNNNLRDINRNVNSIINSRKINKCYTNSFIRKEFTLWSDYFNVTADISKSDRYSEQLAFRRIEAINQIWHTSWNYILQNK